MRDMMGGPPAMGGLAPHMNDNDSNIKKDVGPKLSLADRLRQLADGTLPLIDERNMDRDMRGPTHNRGSSMDRVDRHGPSADRHGPAADRHGPPADRHGPAVDRHGPPIDRHGSAVDRHGPNNERIDRGRAPSMEVQPSSLLPLPRRPNEGPPSLLDLPPNFPGELPNKFPGDIPGKFPLPHVGPGPDFSGPGAAFGGPRGVDRDMRDFPQRGGPGKISILITKFLLKKNA